MSKINKNNGVPTEKQGFSHGESESPERLMSAAQSVRKLRICACRGALHAWFRAIAPLKGCARGAIIGPV